MKKITFQEWKKNFEDIPYIKENYKKIHEDYGIPKDCINGGDNYELSPTTTICVRVFKHGGFYEITLNSKYYLLLGNEDWLEEKTDVIEKELYEWCNGEIFNTENDYCVECGCDLTHRDDGDDKCCWCIERIQKEKNEEEN